MKKYLIFLLFAFFISDANASNSKFINGFRVEIEQEVCCTIIIDKTITVSTKVYAYSKIFITGFSLQKWIIKKVKWSEVDNEKAIQLNEAMGIKKILESFRGF